MTSLTEKITIGEIRVISLSLGENNVGGSVDRPFYEQKKTKTKRKYCVGSILFMTKGSLLRAILNIPGWKMNKEDKTRTEILETRYSNTTYI